MRYRSQSHTFGKRLPAMCSSSRNPSSDPRSEATVCVVTRGNIAGTAATAFCSATNCFADGSNDRIQRRTVQWRKECQSIHIERKGTSDFLKPKPTV
jgi:predicted CxxxxCH...CXXCH cytochrome family protein